MRVELENLKEQELKKCSYINVLNVIETLEYVKPINFYEIEAIEKLESYLAFVIIIQDRLEQGDFAIADPAEENLVSLRLRNLNTNFSMALSVNSLVGKKQNEINLLHKQTVFEVEEKQREIQIEVNHISEKIEKSEHKSLSHVMTLMGIFSAIITIVMSVVITSTSWLNNADEASAIVAFVIPNLVVLLSVIVLISLVYFYNSFYFNHIIFTIKNCIFPKPGIVSISFPITLLLAFATIILNIFFSFLSMPETLHSHLFVLFLLKCVKHSNRNSSVYKVIPYIINRN